MVLKHILTIIREVFPRVRIIFRGDAGFAIPEIYRFCEENEILYIAGFPKNKRVLKLAENAMNAAREQFAPVGHKVRIFHHFTYKADTWKKERRIIVKAEVTGKGENPRFLVTNIKDGLPGNLYRNLYVKRGEMENRIKELKSDLKADRTSCHSFPANQFRLLLSLSAYYLYQEVKKNLKNTKLEKAQVGTVRSKLVKIGARIKETVRRVRIQFASTFPLRELFENLMYRLGGLIIPALDTS